MDMTSCKRTRYVPSVCILGGLPFFENKAMKYASMMYVYVCIFIIYIYTVNILFLCFTLCTPQAFVNASVSSSRDMTGGTLWRCFGVARTRSLRWHPSRSVWRFFGNGKSQNYVGMLFLMNQNPLKESSGRHQIHQMPKIGHSHVFFVKVFFLFLINGCGTV